MAELSEEEGGLALLVNRKAEDQTSPLAHLRFQRGGQDFAINLIPVAEIEGSLLVAVPHSAWDRKVADRMSPRRALTRVVSVEVLIALAETPNEVLHDEEPMRLWVGFLEKGLATRVVGEELEEVSADIVVGRGTDEAVVPYHGALLELAREHFAFHTAESGGPEEEAKEEDLKQKLLSMEAVMVEMQQSIAKLVGGPSKPATGASSHVDPKPKRKSALKVNPTKDAELAGLDQTVVASARTAGISDDQLRQLAAVLKKPNRMEDTPNMRRKDVLSESEESEAGEGAEDAEQDAEEGGEKDKAVDPVGKAIVKLTQIASQLSKPKKTGRDLEDLLDCMEGGGESGSTSSSGARSRAAIFMKLRKALTDNPEYLYTRIEQLMEEDFQQLRAAPGSSGQRTSSRAWLEHRSKLQFFPQAIRFGWILSGIHDSLKEGRTKEARARVSLALMALDQSSLDSGSWLLSQEALLEDPAPFASFQGRRLPEVWEQSASRLLDERWLSVFTWKLKEKDSYIEARRRLGQGKGSKGAGKDQDPNADVANPKKSQKGSKGGGKAENKGDRQQAERET